jgi:methylated-DNA-[protein]-cysteine S-methyltransferase
MTLHTVEIDSPIGPLKLTSNGKALTGVEMLDVPSVAATTDGGDDVLAAARRELDRYFAGKLREFTLALAPAGTDFQRRVWCALCEIPYGTTISYRELATRIGQPTATRAVGLANGRNPIAVVIPCHRVIGADGSLTGYGGGLPRKQFLLGLESSGSGALLSPAAEAPPLRHSVPSLHLAPMDS